MSSYGDFCFYNSQQPLGPAIHLKGNSLSTKKANGMSKSTHIAQLICKCSHSKIYICYQMFRILATFPKEIFACKNIKQGLSKEKD